MRLSILASTAGLVLALTAPARAQSGAVPFFPEAITPSGAPGYFQMDSSKYLYVNCAVGCSGGGGGGAVTGAAGSFVDGWNLTLGTKADAAWSGSGSASEIAIEKAIYAALVGTVPVSAASLPLPTGAATSANQTAAQGTVAAGSAPTNTGVVGGVYNSALPTLTTGQTAGLQTDSSGILYTHANGGTQAVSIVSTSSGGASWARAINGAASAMATSVKSSAGQVYGWHVCNANAAAVYFRIYNLSAAPTVGSATGIIDTEVIPGAATTGAPSCSSYSTDVGIVMGTGIAYDVTAGSFADSDTTTITTASTVSVTIFYK